MDPDLFRRMQEAARRFKTGESDFEEIMTPAGPAHLVRDQDDPRGFRIDFVGGGARTQVPVQEYPAAGGRPPGYPAPLPFLPGCRASVNTLDQSVTWLDPSKPDQAFAHLIGELEGDGWTNVNETGSQPAWRRRFEKDGVERVLELREEAGSARLMLSEVRR